MLQSRMNFMLSYINRGEADSWKEFYMGSVLTQADGSYKWLKLTDLLKNLWVNFKKEDELEESLRKLKTMKQGSKTAKEHVNEFQIYKAHAKITNNPLTVWMFRQTLNPSLAMKILTNKDKSNTLEDTANKEGWYTKAIQYNQIFRDTQAAQQEDRGNHYQQNDNRNNQSFWQTVQQSNNRIWCNTITETQMQWILMLSPQPSIRWALKNKESTLGKDSVSIASNPDTCLMTAPRRILNDPPLSLEKCDPIIPSKTRCQRNCLLHPHYESWRAGETFQQIWERRRRPWR